MKDVQSQTDMRRIPLKHVGIKNLRWPVILKDKEQGEQHSVATISLAVDLPHEIRGTHMSRFVETHMSRFVECMQTVGAISPNGLEEVLDTLKTHLQAEKAFICMEFPYFIYKTSPVTGQRAPMDLNCVLTASLSCALWRKCRCRPCARAARK